MWLSLSLSHSHLRCLFKFSDVNDNTKYKSNKSPDFSIQKKEGHEPRRNG